MINRIHSANDVEGPYKRVLCVCSAGMLRSATMQWVFSQNPYNYNCRCAGTEDYAIVPVTDGLIQWSDEIVCAKQHHAQKLKENFYVASRPLIVLDINDNYNYREELLVRLIHERYKKEQ